MSDLNKAGSETVRMSGEGSSWLQKHTHRLPLNGLGPKSFGMEPEVVLHAYSINATNALQKCSINKGKEHCAGHLMCTWGRKLWSAVETQAGPN